MVPARAPMGVLTMAKLILSVLVGLVVGALGTRFLMQKFEEEHRHARSVMTLLAFHHDRLDAAAKAGHCADFATERTQLVALQREIALAFPKAYKDEEGFRKDADGLATALAAPVAAAGDAAAGDAAACPDAAAQSQKAYDACDTCHKTYDPS